ncbi:hypothetical protein RHSIM_Rhsim02G0202000 [Rhododendron simsii]|uniref:Sugar phosphate transporter domain-containing protein n=1 Tax=Rhododendron simsii TaxID=118357 RepID=A0A834HCH6_RHOSS|nr:hypothetical protein RHSIM_Rhsim02G0202000 [Rhododendron simsii]
MASSSSMNKMELPVSDPSRGGGDERLFKGSGMTKRGAYAAVSYMSCAVLLVLFNKAALSSYSFPSANVITLLQMICSCAFLFALRRWKLISFGGGESLSISDKSTTFVPLKTLIHTLPLAVTYLLYMLATMESVRGVNVPMYTTLRRTTVVFAMVVEAVLAGQKYTSSVVGSVALIVLGAFIAGARDLSFDSYGYAVVFLANITTAIYLATIARIGKSSGLNSFGLMWCNGIICGPFLLFWTFIRGDLELTLNFPYLFSPGFLNPLHCDGVFSVSPETSKTGLEMFLYKEEMRVHLVRVQVRNAQGLSYFFVLHLVLSVVLLLSCILAFFLNYSIFLNTTLNSALTQTICGNLKDLFTIGLGWMLFGGLPFDFLNVLGQLLGFIGSGLYAYYKLIGK